MQYHINRFALIEGTRPIGEGENATAIEYGLIAALISVGIIAAATTFGNSLSNLSGGGDNTEVVETVD